MRFGRLALAVTLLACTSATSAADGFIALQSPYDVEMTVQRLEQQVAKRGLNIFVRIDHAAGAAKAGLTLRPTTLLVFGNPQGGTPFMLCEQTVGIDLPLKALVWEDASAQTWLGYDDPAFIAKRHDVSKCPVVEKLQRTLESIARDTVIQ